MLKSKISVIIIPMIILFNSCKSQKHIGSTEKEYIMAYEKAVFYGCFNEATNGNFAEFTLANNDLGTAIETAILYHSDVLNAIELGAKLSNNIREINYADYQGKKPIFSDCMEFAFSKYVDSIAKKKYKTLKKSKLEYKME